MAKQIVRRYDTATEQSLARERATVRRSVWLFWFFVIAGLALAIFIATI